MTALALVAAVAIGASAVYAAVSNGGAVTAVRVATETGMVSTRSATSTDIPGMSVNVNVPSGQRALLIITVSAEASCVDLNSAAEPDSEGCMVGVRVDGNAASPGGVRFAEGAHGHSERRAQSMQWVYGPVGPGQHTVKAQYFLYTGDNTAVMYLYTRTLTVLRAKVG